MIKHWTPEEEITLIELKTQGLTYSSIASRLGRSLQAVQTRGKRLISQGRLEPSTKGGNFNWTEEEESKLYEESLDYDDLVILLGKTRRAIQSKCEKLGISKRFTISTTGTQFEGKKALLYLVDFGEFKKVGVTQVPLEVRFIQDSDFILLDSCEMVLEDALETEKEILRNMRKFRFKGTIRRGSTECFKLDCTLLDEII